MSDEAAAAMRRAWEAGRLHEVGRNVEQIRAQATRVTWRMPLGVRRELLTAVRAGLLGRLPKDGLKPEVFFHPDHRNGAIERQNREAAYSVNCIASVIASPADVRAGIEAMGGDVLAYALAERTSTAVVKQSLTTPEGGST
jgi:hypothetical protein